MDMLVLGRFTKKVMYCVQLCTPILASNTYTAVPFLNLGGEWTLGVSTCSCHPCSIINFVHFLVFPSLLHSTIYSIDFYVQWPRKMKTAQHLFLKSQGVHGGRGRLHGVHSPLLHPPFEVYTSIHEHCAPLKLLISCFDSPSTKF